MKKPQILFFLVILGFCAHGRPLGINENNFSLALSFEEPVFIKEAVLLRPIGTELPIEKYTHTFKGYVSPYAVFTLSVAYVSEVDKKEKYIAMSLFLQPGETKLFFKKNPKQYVLNGASSENHARFKGLQIMDEALIKKIQNATVRLNYALDEENKNLIKKLRDSLRDWEQERSEIVYGDFIRKNPNSLVSLYALRMYGNINLENPLEVQRLINTIPRSWQKIEEMVTLRGKIESAKKIMVGVQAPVFAQPDTAGKVILLTDLQGQYVLINFWASWSAACRKQTPSLLKLYSRFGHNGFTILGVSLDSGKPDWVKAINDDHVNWLQVSDLQGWKNEVAMMYNIRVVPQNYLLNRQGTIIAKNLDEQELTTMIERIILLEL